jgi:tight adherence protein B
MDPPVGTAPDDRGQRVTSALTVLCCVAAVVLWPLAGDRSRPPPRPGREVGTWGPAPPARPRAALPGGVRGLRARLRGGSRRWTQRLDDDTADLLGALVAPLRAGAPPLTALQAAAEALGRDTALHGVVERLVRAGHEGGSLAEVWLEHGTSLDSAALRFVGSAWSVSEATGAPLADALACAEQVLRTRRRAADRLRSAVAGPRASMTVLALLPVSGPVVGLACGLTPRELYLSSPVGTASLAVGAAWAAFAWWWAQRIVRAAS